jgi:hypothetical protein
VQMEYTAIAMLLKPFAALLLFGVILLPFRIAVQKWMPEGRWKRLLLTRIGNRGGRGGLLQGFGKR